jgi:hypothetical protein
MHASGTEVINLEGGIDYTPTFISTDKRSPAGSTTSIGYWQIGADAQYGYTHGPIYQIEFLDVAEPVGASVAFIAIWGVDNQGSPAIYPISYFYDAAGSVSIPRKIDILLKKFEFWDSNLDDITSTVDDSLTYVVGYKRRTFPLSL